MGPPSFNHFFQKSMYLLSLARKASMDCNWVAWVSAHAE